MDLLLGTLAVVFILATLLPMWKHEAWWIRIFDFPRAQIAAGGLVVAVTHVAVLEAASGLEIALLVALVACAVYQSWKMLPYTRLHPRQVKATGSKHGKSARFSVLIANVLMENREADRFVELVRMHDPDVVLTVETDAWWADRLSSLDDSYPHSVRVPLPNTYGMQLQTRMEIVESDVEYLVDDSVPSIHAVIRLPGGQRVRLHCLHPRPPGPTQDADTVDRDAELLIVGRTARASEEPTIVMGDLNDVAWSYTTKLFQKISGLLDPRIGRGMFSTFHAKNPLLRWPLDHLFHSDHFKLARIERLPAWGSDHFPILVQLQYSEDAVDEHDCPVAGPEEREEALEKIEKAF